MKRDARWPLWLPALAQSTLMNRVLRGYPYAKAAIDVAAHDAVGKIYGVPVYQLLGGASRDAVLVYGHASGSTVEETVASVARFQALGYKAVRAQCSVPGVEATYGIGKGVHPSLECPAGFLVERDHLHQRQDRPTRGSHPGRGAGHRAGWQIQEQGSSRAHRADPPHLRAQQAGSSLLQSHAATKRPT